MPTNRPGALISIISSKDATILQNDYIVTLQIGVALRDHFNWIGLDLFQAHGHRCFLVSPLNFLGADPGVPRY